MGSLSYTEISLVSVYIEYYLSLYSLKGLNGMIGGTLFAYQVDLYGEACRPVFGINVAFST